MAITTGIKGPSCANYVYSHVTADTLVKSGRGSIHTISLVTPPTTGGVLTLYDNTEESGTDIIAAIKVADTDSPLTLTLDVRFKTGLYAGFDETLAGANFTISYL